MGFRLIPTSVTLNDLERRNGPYCVFSPTFIALQTDDVTLVKDRHKYRLPVSVFHF